MTIKQIDLLITSVEQACLALNRARILDRDTYQARTELSGALEIFYREKDDEEENEILFLLSAALLAYRQLSRSVIDEEPQNTAKKFLLDVIENLDLE